MRIPKVDLQGLWEKASAVLLCTCWLIGLTAGIFSAYISDDTVVQAIRAAVAAPVSMSGLFIADILPFLLSAYIVYFSEPWLLLFISMGKGFSFAFCACGIALAFGQSSWLVRFLFLFSDMWLLPMLMYYWLRHIHGKNPVKLWGLTPYLFTASFVCWVDYSFIAPFLVSVMNR